VNFLTVVSSIVPVVSEFSSVSPKPVSSMGACDVNPSEMASVSGSGPASASLGNSLSQPGRFTVSSSSIYLSLLVSMSKLVVLLQLNLH